jgi:hypothetical protein
MQLTVQLPPIQLRPPLASVLDHRQVHRVEDDDRVVLHAQGAGGVDPVAVPARGAQLGEDLGGVVAALAGDDDVAALERVDVEGVLAAWSRSWPCAGALPPALLVEKNTGSMSAKSPSACMRSISTEPTMPRQPTNPTSAIFRNCLSD